MQKHRFTSLKKGESATLTVSAPIYGSYHFAPGKQLFIAPGTTGTLGAVQCPNVYGPEGYFHCLDFPDNTPLIDRNGKPVTDLHGSKPFYRVAITANMI